MRNERRVMNGNSNSTGPAPRDSEFPVCFLFTELPDFPGETSNLKNYYYFWRLQNTAFCQNVVPMGTTFRQKVVFRSLQQVVVLEVRSLSGKIRKFEVSNELYFEVSHRKTGKSRSKQKFASTCRRDGIGPDEGVDRR